jgi:vancomycin aglycone glucosyltransferase
MRVLLATIGSRGDVQPMVALALHLREVGHSPRICAPPNFGDWVQGFGVPFVPLGHDLTSGPQYVPGGAKTTVAVQFAALRAAAAECDVIVGCAVMQIAARSIAEMRGIPYFYASYAPVTLPSEHHRPVPTYEQTGPGGNDCRAQWDRDAQWWNDTWRDALNTQRADVGLPAVSDVRGHVLTDRPLLAADPLLAPWTPTSELSVVQTGAWLMTDREPLPPKVESFLDDGEPPIYFGFGSMRVALALGPTVVAAAAALGYRAIVLRGWARLTTPPSPNWLPVEEINHQTLFPRVAAVVHHGGSGTTTAAARAGIPQVVIPHHYDQYYYAERVAALGIGTAHSSTEPTVDSLTGALERVLCPAVAAEAKSVAGRVRTDGTAVTAGVIVGG